MYTLVDAGVFTLASSIPHRLKCYDDHHDDARTPPPVVDPAGDPTPAPPAAAAEARTVGD